MNLMFFSDYNYNANLITNFESFKYKRTITGKTSMEIKKMVKLLSKEIQRLKKLEIVVTLKHLSN